jgi:cyclic pyranopterin phosphate synthase
MVNVGPKPAVSRRAIAEGKLFLSPGTGRLIQEQTLPKGSPVEVARLAGIQAAKQTHQLIPLCHSLNLDFADVEVELKENFFLITSRVECRRSTGVEMEALTAVSVAALTLYDMIKAVDRNMTLGEIRLLKKQKEE